MLADSAYITCSNNWLYLVVISNIQYHISTRKTQFQQNIKGQGILPIFMLSYVVNLYSFGAWCINVLYNRHYMSFFSILNSTKNFIKNDDIYLIAIWSVLSLINILQWREYPTFYASSSFFHKDFNWRLETRNISNTYVSRWCLYHPFNELIMRGCNIKHTMLAFHKENTVSQKNKCLGIFPISMLERLVNIYNFSAWCIYRWHSRQYLSVFPILYSRITF